MGLLDRVEKKITYEPNSGCWLWTGGLTKEGYGMLSVRTGLNEYAHRYVYNFFVGEVPKGLELDHLCRTRSCVNPSHLDPVTHSLNTKRGNAGKWERPDQCKRGHPLYGNNLKVIEGKRGKRGSYRSCKECNRARAIKSYYKNKGA